MKTRARTDRRVFVWTATMLLALVPTLAFGTGDFDELPLAPLVPRQEVEEPEEVDPVEEEEGPSAAEVADPPDETPPRRRGAGAPDGALALIAHAGTFLPLSDSMPFGVELGAAVERPLGFGGLSLRVDASWSSHRQAGARLLPGMGLDEGFAEVANLIGARAGAAWRPLGTSSGLYLHASVGALVSLADRRVFSVESRTTRWRPTAALGVGFDLSAGPGRVRLETAIRGVSLAMGPEGAPIASAMAGSSLALAYRIDI